MSMPDLHPVKGMVCLRFFDEEDDDDRNPASGDGEYPAGDDDDTCLAQVLATGPGTGVKKGQIVLVRGYARQCPRVDDDTVIADYYVILAVVETA